MTLKIDFADQSTKWSSIKSSQIERLLGLSGDSVKSVLDEIVGGVDDIKIEVVEGEENKKKEIAGIGDLDTKERRRE